MRVHKRLYKNLSWTIFSNDRFTKDPEALELSIKVQSKNTQNLTQPYRLYLLSASSPAEVRAG